MCKELLRTRLHNVNELEKRLRKMTKYSIKLLNAQDELALTLSQEKETLARLAAAVGVSTYNTGCVVSDAMVLEECCNIMLDNERLG
eukprot:jgi/Phyca11/100562/e_gw1.5.1279.1